MYIGRWCWCVCVCMFAHHRLLCGHKKRVFHSVAYQRGCSSTAAISFVMQVAEQSVPQNYPDRIDWVLTAVLTLMARMLGRMYLRIRHIFIKYSIRRRHIYKSVRTENNASTTELPLINIEYDHNCDYDVASKWASHCCFLLLLLHCFDCCCCVVILIAVGCSLTIVIFNGERGGGGHQVIIRCEFLRASETGILFVWAEICVDVEVIYFTLVNRFKSVANERLTMHEG